MGVMIQDIHNHSNATIQLLKKHKYELDYSIDSFILLDKFINIHSNFIDTIDNSEYIHQFDKTIFGIGAYIGESLRKNIVNSRWVVNTERNAHNFFAEISLFLPDGELIYPVQQAIRRAQMGPREALYIFGYNTASRYKQIAFNQNFESEFKRII